MSVPRTGVLTDYAARPTSGRSSTATSPPSASRSSPSISSPTLTYLELPPVGDSADRRQGFGEIETVKAASATCTPRSSGEVVERQRAALDDRTRRPDLSTTTPTGRAG